jgi:hypothetical protein
MQLKMGKNGQLEWTSGKPLTLLTPGVTSTVSGAGVACTISCATPDSGVSYVLPVVECGYDADPAAGSKVFVQTYAGTTIWQMPITKGGPCVFDLSDALANINTGIKVCMSAPGGSILGYLNVRPKKVGDV